MSLQNHNHAGSKSPNENRAALHPPLACTCMGHWSPNMQTQMGKRVAAIRDDGVAASSTTDFSKFHATKPSRKLNNGPGKGQKILIRGGNIITMSEKSGDYSPGDILIDGDRIVAIDHKIDALDAYVIDAKGMIVMPGMIDTHRHTWQSSVHALGPDWLLSEYFQFMRGVIGRVYRPEDLYIATQLGALEAIDSGITTLVDWAHLMNGPEHADASVMALQDTGIRAQFAYGNSNAGFEFPNDIRLNAKDAQRVRDQYFSSTDGLVSMALALRGPEFSDRDVWMDDFRAARDLGLPITVHVGASGTYANPVGQLNSEKLLGSDITHVHCVSLRDDEYKMIADTGGKVSISVEAEMHLGCGATPVSKMLANGIRPSISTDTPSVNSCDMFGALRTTLGTHRGSISQQMLDYPDEKTESRLTTGDMLEFATLRGAEATGLSGKVGQLVPGMQADIVLISYGRVGLFPLHSPTALVVMNATPSDVDTVLIAGKIMKRNGVLDVDHSALVRGAEDSVDYLYSQSKMHARPASYSLSE